MKVHTWMKSAIVTGDRVILVPYKEVHVPKYHEWMQDKDLQYLTGSEPLTLEKEFEMQRSWATDEDKCTFIVLEKEVFEKSGDEVESMIGDTNVFLKKDQDTEETVGEVEVMIARREKRGQGLGEEVICLMIRYAIEVIGLESLEAKIKSGNSSSLALFKKLCFKEKSFSEVFDEVTLACTKGPLLGATEDVKLKYEVVSS